MCVISTLATIGAGIATAASAVGSAAASVGSALAGGLATAGSAIASGTTAAISGIGSGLTAVGSTIAEGATALGASVMEGAAALGSSVAEGAATVGTTIAEGAQTAAASVGLAEAPAGAALAQPAMASTAGQSVNSIMSAELAEMGFVGNAAQGGVEMGNVAAEIPAATSDLIVKGALAAGAGIATGAMSYDAALTAAQTQASAQEEQARQARLSADLAEQNKKNALKRAEQEREAGETEAMDKTREARQEIGSGLARMAGQGVMIEGRKESMSTMYEADQKAELAYDKAKIMQNAEMRAWGYETEAINHQMEALSQGYAAASLDKAAQDTLRIGRKQGIVQGITQGLTTAISAGSLLI